MLSSMKILLNILARILDRRSRSECCFVFIRQR